MRGWLTRLRTVFAIIAVIILIIKIPVAYQMITTPDIMLNQNAAPSVVLRIWYCESWTGNGMQWLLKQIAAFEKANKGTRVTVRSIQKNEWLVDGLVIPDILLFEAGALHNPEEWLMQIKNTYSLKEPFQFTGMHHGLQYAVPVCYGGNVRLVNENKLDGIELIMEGEQQYQDFVAEKASALIASVREVRRLTALVDAGKGFPFQAQPYGDKTDKVLFASVFGNTGERAGSALAFLDFLLSEQAQNMLPEAGLLPTTQNANALDESKQPLLFAMETQIIDVINAFD